MWALMEHFGNTTLPDELGGTNIHRLENVMSLCVDFHSLFDDLWAWFVATVRPPYLRVESISDMFHP